MISSDLHPAGQSDHQRHRSQIRWNEGGDEQQQEHAGEAEHDIGESHQRGVDPTAVIGRRCAHREADDHGHQHGRDADGQRYPTREHQPRKHVATEVVGTQPVSGTRRRRITIDYVDVIGIERGQPRGQRRADEKDRDDDDAKEREPMAHELFERPQPSRRLDGDVFDESVNHGASLADRPERRECRRAGCRAQPRPRPPSIWPSGSDSRGYSAH